MAGNWDKGSESEQTLSSAAPNTAMSDSRGTPLAFLDASLNKSVSLRSNTRHATAELGVRPSLEVY
jgi:hypothetical protein